MKTWMLRATFLIQILGFSTAADAALVTFRIHSDLGARGIPTSSQGTGLEEATGLSGSGPFDIFATFTLDTDASGQVEDQQSSFIIDRPGTGLSVEIGRLTVFFPVFSVFLQRDTVGTILDISSVPFLGSGLGPFVNFKLASLAPSRDVLPDLTLGTFVASDLSSFGPIGIGNFFVPRFEPDKTWFLEGTSRSITRVSEPNIFLLLSMGLGALGFFALGIFPSRSKQ